MRKIITLLLVVASCSLFAQFINNQGMSITNTAILVTNGDWSNIAAPGAPDGPVIVNEGTIVLSDSWSNSGTISGKGTFVLDYASDKNFRSGSGLIGTLIKKGAGAASVSGSLHIGDTLMLSNGLLKLSATSDTLVINTPLVVASSSSYVEGLVAHKGEGNRLYPVGKDGHYLPLTLYKLKASKATASVDAAPANQTAGPGVDALINFPYAWTVVKQNASDTSAYVEVSYPDVLPSVANPIVVRGIAGNEYASMGARYKDAANSRITVRSYSRRLNGVFSVAQGFPTDFETDSLALVALYNSTAGAGWTNKTNWLVTEKPVEIWAGVTVTGQSITSLSLPSNNLSGEVPDELVDILSLQTINLSGNKITAIPAFSDNPEIKTLNVSNNHLEFGSLEANTALLDPAITFNYSNQADIGEPVRALIDVGTDHDLSASTEGKSNSYKWKRNGTEVTGATEKAYTITAINRSNMGEYVCEITNSYFPGLTIKTAPYTALAVANISGKLYATEGSAAAKGDVTLFNVNTTGKYDTTATQAIQADGSYKFERVVLDDYQVMGFADTLSYALALPTYFENSIFWEEAKTLVVENNLTDIDIVSQYKPKETLTGVGIISGTIIENVDDPAGRAQKEKRVANAGASVRKVENAARPQAERLTLVAYVFSNEEGEFVLPNLPKASYRLNIQYPGYPMDETSYINIDIGDGLQSQVRVAATVDENKIKVDKLVVTGVWEAEKYTAEMFPNPSAESVFVRFNATSDSRWIKLMDSNGRELYTKQTTQEEGQLNVKELPVGIYLLQIVEEGRVMKTIRIAKQ